MGCSPQGDGDCPGGGVLRAKDKESDSSTAALFKSSLTLLSYIFT
jgi:hypothetical protein